MDSKTKRTLRRRLYIDREVQRGLIVRAILYWFFSLSAILLVVGIASAWLDPTRLAIVHVYPAFVYLAPGILASILLLPLFIYDMLHETNRIAGPIYRLRNEIRKLVDGNDIRRLQFREKDHWMGLAEDFNELAELMMEMREQQGHPDVKTETQSVSSLMRV